VARAGAQAVSNTKTIKSTGKILRMANSAKGKSKKEKMEGREPVFFLFYYHTAFKLY
jgi:hypothetical protein